jgi:hypothetical protein
MLNAGYRTIGQILLAGGGVTLFAVLFFPGGALEYDEARRVFVALAFIGTASALLGAILWYLADRKRTPRI